MSRTPRDTAGRDPALPRWEIVGLIALATIVVAIPLSLFRSARPGTTPALAAYVNAIVDALGASPSLKIPS